MKLSELKSTLSQLSDVQFELFDSTPVPSHFHVTEAGLATKHFIDCGGTIREESNVTFQLWSADDTEHRLTPEKFLGIITKSQNLYEGNDPEIEVEYQMETIGRFGLEFKNDKFILTQKETDCLAKDKCGVPDAKPKVRISEFESTTVGACEPGSGCC